MIPSTITGTNTGTTRVAVVTGANKGIGFAIARQLAELGMTVHLGARDEERGRAAEAELCAAGLDVRFVHLDVTDEATVALAAKQVEEVSGRLDVLVNNAGTSSPWKPPSQTSTDEVRSALETNVLGVVTVTNAMLPLLRRSEAGRIVNLSSTFGSLTAAAENRDPGNFFPPGAFPVILDYPASKAALNAVTLMYANELRESGILVNAVCPGYVATDRSHGHGALTPEQGALVPVRLATLRDGGPTGTFTGSDGTPNGLPLPW
ncbi:SDR family oxidoreductase [Streptomyces sp. NPDC006872]|uniref:SDR family oxidoreductase n=1 Tax=Streptomyces sp. NPDC006872 TaxID=3155720 RepID=UPI0033C7AF35